MYKPFIEDTGNVKENCLHWPSQPARAVVHGRKFVEVEEEKKRKLNSFKFTSDSRFSFFPGQCRNQSSINSKAISDFTFWLAESVDVSRRALFYTTYRQIYI